MDTIRQRNRFMAFAFAGADILLETNNDGIITFALGATKPLMVEAATDLEGRAVVDLIAAHDAGLVQHLIDSIGTEERFGPISVSSAATAPSKSFMLSGGRFFGHEGGLCFTISYETRNGPAVARAERGKHTGLVDAQDFEEVAVEALQIARKNKENIKLSLFSFEGQQAFTAKLDRDVAKTFLGQIGAILRKESFADAAGQQADGQYAILHASNANVESIAGQLEKISKSLDPKAKGVRVDGNSLEINPKMSARDAASTLMFAIGQFVSNHNSEFKSEELCCSLDSVMRDAGARMSDFRSVIAQGKLHFMKQPIVDLKTMVTHHYEMLVRFEENKSPFEMICFAEETGLIMELDSIVLKQAISCISHDYANAGPDKKISLAVNISGRSLSSPVFTVNLYRLLEKVGFSRSSLMLEITESSIIENLEHADHIIQKIRKLGHCVCLDDFGAGAASFQYLRALTVDYIKIDGAYIRTALKRKREAMLLKAISGLAHDLDTRTIAESVETKEQSTMLLNLGVDQGQGFLFGHPQPLTCAGKNNQAA